MSAPRKLEIGERFGKLTVTEQKWTTRKGPYMHTYYACMCDCGTEHLTTDNNMLHGLTKSCGCLRSGGRAAVKKQVGTQLAKTLKAAEPYMVPASGDRRQDGSRGQDAA